MTSYYYNSAGTDLDSIFYSDNSSVGALGYYNSSGTDLGNKYASGSLGYGVGYYNSAGTDIGYLRGALVAISLKSYGMTASSISAGHSFTYSSDGESGAYMSSGYNWFKGYITLSVALNTATSFTWQYVVGISGTDGCSSTVYGTITDNSTSVPSSASTAYNGIRTGSKAGSWSEVVQVLSKSLSYTSVSSASRNIAFHLRNNAYTSTSYFRAPSLWVRIYLTNSLGSTSYYYLHLTTSGTKSTSSSAYTITDLGTSTS